jgi:hypothetical protein
MARRRVESGCLFAEWKRPLKANKNLNPSTVDKLIKQLLSTSFIATKDSCFLSDKKSRNMLKILSKKTRK